MYLQLAEGENNGNYSALAQNSTLLDNYVFVPAGFLDNPENMYVRADYFATNFDPVTANALIDELAKRQVVGMSVVPIPPQAITAGLNAAKKLVGGIIEKRQAAVAAGTKKPLFKPGGIFDKLKTKILQGGAGGAMEKKGPITEPVGGSITLPQGTINAGFIPAEQPTTGAGSFFQKNKTLLIVGGAALLVGGVYLATRKKRR